MQLENGMVLGRDAYGVNEQHEPEQVDVCEYCRQPIYKGEEVVGFGDHVLCDDDVCLSEYLRLHGVRYIAE